MIPTAEPTTEVPNRTLLQVAVGTWPLVRAIYSGSRGEENSSPSLREILSASIALALIKACVIELQEIKNDRVTHAAQSVALKLIWAEDSPLPPPSATPDIDFPQLE